MSGGVDSSVSALLLKQAGHQVIGMTMKLWDNSDSAFSDKSCCTLEMANDAKRVCSRLNIPHYTVDLQAEFKSNVIDPFIEDYLNGRTPNPCVSCNSKLKWVDLFKKARSLGFNHLATGHYSQIITSDDGNSHLIRGVDGTKDQSYFLWEIPRETLSFTLFPLGHLKKTEVREIAKKNNLLTAEKTESQEICFIPDNDYRKWLKDKHPDISKGKYNGEMLDTSGKALGKHAGFPFFTIGQRKKLGLGGGKKYYVTSINSLEKSVIVGNKEDLLTNRIRIKRVNVFQNLECMKNSSYEIKIRYRDPGEKGNIIENRDGALVFKTDNPVSAVTPGQSAVIYQGDEVLAGGIIC